MFVGASGVGRVVQRSAELMVEHDTTDVAEHGGIDLATLQRYVNFHFSVSLDLFGSERSTNAANYYAAGLKGRFAENDHDDDHVLLDREADYQSVSDGRIVSESMTARSLVNQELRTEYVEDCAKGVRRWNRILAERGVDVELRLPHVGFNRAVGAFAGHRISPTGEVLDDPTWAARVGDWLPSDEERAHVGSLMVPVTEPGSMAGWIAAPATGLNTKPVDFDYVRL